MIIQKVWGSEEVLVNTDTYCGKILRLDKGARCSLHYHNVKDETFYLISGRFMLLTGLQGERYEKKILEPGDSFRIVPGCYHRFWGIEDSVIAEFSTHHDDADVVRLEPSVAA